MRRQSAEKESEKGRERRQTRRAGDKEVCRSRRIKDRKDNREKRNKKQRLAPREQPRKSHVQC